MRVFDNGAFFTVQYSEWDAIGFSHNWPGSSVEGSGSFQFDKRNGDLVDATGSALEGDGADWLAFSQDCQEYGTKRLAKKQRAEKGGK